MDANQTTSLHRHLMALLDKPEPTADDTARVKAGLDVLSRALLCSTAGVEVAVEPTHGAAEPVALDAALEADLADAMRARKRRKIGLTREQQEALDALDNHADQPHSRLRRCVDEHRSTLLAGSGAAFGAVKRYCTFRRNMRRIAKFAEAPFGDEMDTVPELDDGDDGDEAQDLLDRIANAMAFAADKELEAAADMEETKWAATRAKIVSAFMDANCA